MTAYMGHPHRSTQLDPELRTIVEWCRTGRHASVSFRCEFLNPRHVDRSTAIFEVSLADLLPNATYRRSLSAIGFGQPIVSGEGAMEQDGPPCGSWFRVRKRPLRS